MTGPKKNFKAFSLGFLVWKRSLRSSRHWKQKAHSTVIIFGVYNLLDYFASQRRFSWNASICERLCILTTTTTTKHHHHHNWPPPPQPFQLSFEENSGWSSMFWGSLAESAKHHLEWTSFFPEPMLHLSLLRASTTFSLLANRNVKRTTFKLFDVKSVT